MRVNFSLRFLMLSFAAVACGLAVFFYTPGLHQTHNDFDLAIVGDGYFQVTDCGDNSDAMIHYTRCGKLRINSEGRLSLRDHDRDWVIEPIISVLSDWTEFVVRENGEVSVFVKGNRFSVSIGCLQIAKFDKPSCLMKEPNGICLSTDGSGQVSIFEAGTHTSAIIRQGWLDESHRGCNLLLAAIVFGIGLLIALGFELKGQHFDAVQMPTFQFAR